jgi:hypothetical protein
VGKKKMPDKLSQGHHTFVNVSCILWLEKKRSDSKEKFRKKISAKIRIENEVETGKRKKKK